MLKNQTKKSLKNSFFLISMLFFFSTVYGQNKVDKINELMNTYHEYEQFNGSVLVSENGKIIFKKGLGLANMEWDLPNESDTKHRLGSITKQFTATLILQQVQAGKLELHVPITTYLPDYPEETGDIITLHHLLTHSSGIPNYTNYSTFFTDYSRDPYSPTEFTKVFQDSTLNFKPGEEYSYSNSGYFLLGVILEKITGKSYEQLLEEDIFAPLGMINTGFDHHSTILKKRATGYERIEGSYINSAYLDMSIPYAAGSMYSTAEDLYLWDQALYSDKILSAEMLELLFGEHMPYSRSGYYGYGWGIHKIPLGENKDSIKMIQHGGGINGFNTIIVRYPDQKNLVVLLNNTGDTRLYRIAKAINNILNDQAYEMPKKSIAFDLLEIILEEGLDTGLKEYQTLLDSEIHELNEGDMNRIGYQLMGRRMIKEAIEVFKLNVEAFPESGNVHDSLGEAYLEDGDKKMALKYYSESVKLDPTNEYGKEVIKRLKMDK